VRIRTLALAAAVAATIAAPVTIAQQQRQPPRAQQPEQLQAKRTYVRLANNANALLVEPLEPGPKSRILAINTHPDHNNNFEYFIGRELVARGYRALGINYYGPEETMEEFLPAIAAAVKYARAVPGVEKVVFATHSGGGPELTFYEEVAENGPSVCQGATRIYPCKGTGLTGLPTIDGLLLLDINIGAPHRTISIDPAVDTSHPRRRDAALDMYAPQNGFDPESNSARYPADFVKRFFAGVHGRSERLIADAQSKLKAIESGDGPYKDNQPLVVAGMAVNAVGARLNMADARILSRTHAAHLHLRADGTTPVEIVRSSRNGEATVPQQRDTLRDTVQNTTVRHFLSFLAVRTTADYALTEDSIKGIDWRSSANSAVGSVENIRVPTLVMAATCAIHLIPLETVFDHSAAPDKDFVAVEGADHGFQPCRPEFGNTTKRAFDYADAWLSKPGRF